MYVSLLCDTQHLLVLTKLNSDESADDAQLLAYITFDNLPEMNLLNNILHLASGSLDTGSMNVIITVNSDDKTDTRYILRSDEEL